ncbi:MAG: sigma-70 family RNA polymerase sigma factor [Firmicutes bacterium]|nr:sigma-70 family RNA polymerase sigma factor [Bacillota bacterium]
MTELKELTDEQLWERASSGEREAEDELYSRYKESVRVKARLYFMLGAEHDDIVQEGMIGLFKAIRSYDPSRGASFATYAELCINTRIISAVKSASRNKYKPLNEAFSLDLPIGPEDEEERTLGDMIAAGPDSDPEATYLSLELEKLIGPESKSFSGFEREVLTALLEGGDYRSIAESMGKTPKQIDNAMQRIRSKIKKMI